MYQYGLLNLREQEILFAFQFALNDNQFITEFHLLTSADGPYMQKSSYSEKRHQFITLTKYDI